MWNSTIVFVSVMIAVVAIAWIGYFLVFKLSKAAALIKCVKTGDTAGVTKALVNGANVNVRSPIDGRSAVEIAIVNGNIKMVETLLGGGAKQDSALLFAATLGKADIIGLLLKKGANPNTCSEFGTPVLYTAAKKHTAEVVHLLLSAGADPNFPFDVPFGRQSAFDRGVCPRVVQQMVKEIIGAPSEAWARRR